MKPAAIYARVSSERQKTDETIQSQVAALREHAQSEGYAILNEWIFLDEGYSGAMLVRPGLERLRDLASEGQFETVLIFSPDRLSRKYAYQVLLLEELYHHGVDVVFLKSARATTPEEELMLQFQGMIAEYERAQIAERTRRGKKHRAKSGSVNVLSGAPYGYRYVKKTESTSASYEVIALEAETVRTVFKLYLEEALSINAIARWLNDQEVPTRKGISRWERSTVWAMLRNPAYRGAACFGKTERAERKRITRPLRSKGGFSPRCSSHRERPREEWVEIPVPAIIEDETFAMAQERLEQNKRFSPRRTIEPTLLQSMVICGECGYAFYRTSTCTSRKKLYYYRCLGSDDYRYPNGRVCHNRPVRQDYLDEIVWKEVIRLLEDPELIRNEIERRLKEIQKSNPTKRKKEVLSKEIARVQKAIEKLLDAYQENLLQLDELRQRMPELRKREKALHAELQGLEAAVLDQRTFLRLAGTMESFLGQLRGTAETLDVKERQKILRLVVKEVLVDRETIRIKHSIPITDRNDPSPKLSVPSSAPGYLLRSWSHVASILRGLELIREGRLLNAAVALYGKSDQLKTLYPQMGVRLARFRGKDRLADFSDNRQYWGHAFSLLRRAESFLIDHVPIAGRVVPEKMVREDQPWYPPRATREALANALCHRDYTVPGGAVAVAMYDNHMEITNPGELHFGITPEKLTGPHESRPWNPIIANVFYRAGIIERWGMGTLNIIDWCAANGNPPPVWSQEAGSVFVNFQPATLPEVQRAEEVTPEVTPEVRLLKKIKGEMSRQALQRALGLKDEEHFRKAYLLPALEVDLIEMTIPDKPRSSKQKYRLTDKGRKALKSGND